MGVKLAKTKIKTPALSSEHWRDAEHIVKLRRQMSKRADIAMARFNELKTEVFEYQAKRVKLNKVTYQDVTSRGLEALVKAVARDKSYRSKIVAIQMEALDDVNYFKEGMSLARRDITGGAYGAQLRKEYKTVAAQRDAIEHYFRHAVLATKQGDFLVKLTDMVISDIDQSAFNDQRLLKAGELIFHPGRAD
jgi:hypothetical protein